MAFYLESFNIAYVIHLKPILVEWSEFYGDYLPWFQGHSGESIAR